MKLLLHRDQCGPVCSHGSLYVDGVFFCYTLEDVDRKMEDGGTKIDGETAIPRGVYKVILDYSNRFKQIMPHLLDVPGFAGIRIHAGNTSSDTHGCVLVGSVRNGDRVLNSRASYNRLMIVLEDELDRGGEIEIEVR